LKAELIISKSIDSRLIRLRFSTFDQAKTNWSIDARDANGGEKLKGSLSSMNGVFEQIG